MTDICAFGHTVGHKQTENNLFSPGGTEGGLPPDFSIRRPIVGTSTFLRPKNPTQVSPGWALGWDQRQWMLLRGRKRQEGAYWQPVRYIASEKHILMRCMAENGCIPDTEGLAFLQTLPDHFRDFKRSNPDEKN